MPFVTPVWSNFETANMDFWCDEAYQEILSIWNQQAAFITDVLS